jgi:glutathione S-transferase
VPQSLPIIEYLEELHPEPPMIGVTPEERLRVRSLERLCDAHVFSNIAKIVHNTHPFFTRWLVQSSDVVTTARRHLEHSLGVLDDAIGDRPFVAGDRPTIADCTLSAAMWFGNTMAAGVNLKRRPNVQRWLENFKARPSARA